jgi:hypothetical protein
MITYNAHCYACHKSGKTPLSKLEFDEKLLAATSLITANSSERATLLLLGQ